MLCDFVEQADGRWVCSSCKASYTRWRNRHCGAFPKETKPADRPTDCQHRGELLGAISCGCGSVSRETEVYQCDIFGSCTLTALGGKAGWNKIGLEKRPAYCRTCEERTP